MAKCIAFTKKGYQCRNGKAKGNDIGDKQPILFCTLHSKKHPDIVILEGTNKVTPYFGLEAYLETLNNFNQSNQPQTQHSIPARDAPKTTIGDITPICTVCGDELPSRSDLIECSSSRQGEYNHLVCRECLKGHVVSLLSDGIASLECMFNKHEHCHGQYTEENIKHSLELQETNEAAAAAATTENNTTLNNHAMDGLRYSKWQEVMAASEIIKFASICDNYLICPLCCKWGCIFEISVGSQKYPFYIRCAACNKEWCTLCKRGAHSIRSCYELTFTHAELADVARMTQVIDKMIQDIATRALTHCCGICGCSYVKEEGCNLMTCPKCNGMSCFICGIKLYYKGDTKYWHFTGHYKADQDARCPLWNNTAGDGIEKQGNTAFNQANIEKEFWKFISSNERNRQVSKLICQRIIANYEKDNAFSNILKNIRTYLRIAL
jgi:hypothetical protein